MTILPCSVRVHFQSAQLPSTRLATTGRFETFSTPLSSVRLFNPPRISTARTAPPHLVALPTTRFPAAPNVASASRFRSPRQFHSSRFAAFLLDTPARFCASLTESLLNDYSALFRAVPIYSFLTTPTGRFTSQPFVPVPLDNSLPRDSRTLRFRPHRLLGSTPSLAIPATPLTSRDRSAPFSPRLPASLFESTPFDFSTLSSSRQLLPTTRLPAGRTFSTRLDFSIHRISQLHWSSPLNPTTLFIAAPRGPGPLFSFLGPSTTCRLSALINAVLFASHHADNSSLLRSPRVNAILLDWSSRLDSPPLGSKPHGSTTQEEQRP